jgi:hypothetical protein
MGVRWRALHDAVEVEDQALPLVIEVNMHVQMVRPNLIQLIEECCSPPRSRGIKQLPSPTETLETTQHRQQRRDADSTAIRIE